MAKIKFGEKPDLYSLGHQQFISDEDLEILNEYIVNSEITSFNIFMNKKVTENLTFLQAIKELLKVCPKIETDTDRFVTNLTEGEQMQVVIDFFHSISPELGIKVENIFSRSQQTFDINFIKDKQDKRYGDNFVAEHSGLNKLDLTVTFNNKIHTMISLAHELAHATGARILEHFEIFNTAQEDESKYQDALIYHITRKQADIDCISEIESLIIEKLFLEYLEKLKIITVEQKQEFFDERKSSFRNDLMLITNQCYTFEHLGSNVTQESFKEFLRFCDENQNNCMNLIKNIIDKRKEGITPFSAKHCFRYVVAEIVSTLWYNKFNSSTISEKRKLLKSFLTFHQTDTSAGLVSVISSLLGMTIGEAGTEFYKLKVKESEQNLEF